MHRRRLVFFVSPQTALPSIPFTSKFVSPLTRHVAHNETERFNRPPRAWRCKTSTMCTPAGQTTGSSANKSSRPGSVSKAEPDDNRTGKSPKASKLSILLFLFGTLTSIPVAILMVLGHLLPNRERRNMWLLKIWLQTTLALSGVRVRAKGVDKYQQVEKSNPTDRPIMIVSNRQSALDVAAIATALPGAPRFLVPERALRVPLLGWILSMAGCVSVSTKDRRKAADTLSKEIGRSGSPLLVFAEGRPGPNGSVGKFLSQPFKAAIAHHAAIVPMSVDGGWHMCADNVIPTRWGTLSVEVHDRIDGSNGDEPSSDKEIANRAFNVISNAVSAH